MAPRDPKVVTLFPTRDDDEQLDAEISIEHGARAALREAGVPVADDEGKTVYYDHDGGTVEISIDAYGDGDGTDMRELYTRLVSSRIAGKFFVSNGRDYLSVKCKPSPETLEVLRKWGRDILAKVR